MSKIDIPQMAHIYVSVNSLGWWANLRDMDTGIETDNYIDINGEVVNWNHVTCYHASREACIEAIEHSYDIITEKE